MNNLTSFLVFNELPIDIRCLIWSHAMPGPRIHRIIRPEPHLPTIGSCRPPLNLLLACHESHDEVLHNLKRLPLPSSHEGSCPSPKSASASKLTSTSTSSSHQPCCPYILFNPLLDTLYLPGSTIPLNYRQWFARPIDFSIVRHLAVDVAWSCQHPTGYDERISIPTIVSLLGNVQDLYIVSERSYFLSERSYFYPEAENSGYQKAIRQWGRIVPIEGRQRKRHEKGISDRDRADAGVADGGCWGWVEPVDLHFWEDLTQASWREAVLATELHEEVDRLAREGGNAAIKPNVPRVEMRFLRFEKRVNSNQEGLASIEFSDASISNRCLAPLPSNTTAMRIVDTRITDHAAIEERWAWSLGARSSGLRFSAPLLKRLGFRKSGMKTFKMPYE